MLLYIIRHGDPIYNPDSLTELGKLQAQAIGKRLAMHGIDKIYSSPLIRAQQTAEPTAILTKKEVVIEPFFSENIAVKYFWDRRQEKQTWLMSSMRNELRSTVKKYGEQWYNDPRFDGVPVKEGVDFFLENSDRFFESLGYKHDRENCQYITENPTEDRIAVFCHEGFGLSWIATILDLPQPILWANFGLGHSDMTVIQFSGKVCTPKVLTHSNDSHLYKEGLPTKYNNMKYI